MMAYMNSLIMDTGWKSRNCSRD